jgi:hypothetical protein
VLLAAFTEKFKGREHQQEVRLFRDAESFQRC